MQKESEWRPETLLQVAGKEHRVGTGLVSAVEQSVTFTVSSQSETPKYQRLSNTANNLELQSLMACLMGSQRAFLTNSGMSALHLILSAELRPGDHILCQEDCYGSTKGLLQKIFIPWGVSVTFAPTGDFAHILERDSQVKAILAESISNPFCVPQNLQRICELGESFGALTIIDNTFASPYNCKPLVLGADYVFESATKYLNGHSDQIAGVVASNGSNIEKLEKAALYLGCFLNSESCVRLTRGLRTFDLRMERHNLNGARFAQAMGNISGVAEVIYGSQESFGSIFRGFGGMVSLRFAPNVNVERLLQSLKLVADVPSLGGTETTACMPLHTTHAWTAPSECARLGVDSSVVRVSVGLENVEDLVLDFQRALRLAQ